MTDPKGYRYVEHGAFSVTHSGGTERHVYDASEGRARLTFNGPSAQALAELAAQELDLAEDDDYEPVLLRWLRIARVTNGQDPNDPGLPLWTGEAEAAQDLQAFIEGITWETDRPDYPGGVAWPEGLADVLGWECPSCRPEVGWVKWQRAERTAQGVRLYVQCGHCGSETEYDETGSEVQE